MEESVRPCLRCDFLVESFSHYCPRCGNYLDTLTLVIPRPGVAAPSDIGSGSTLAFVLCVGGALTFAAASIVAGAWAFLTSG